MKPEDRKHSIVVFEGGYHEDGVWMTIGPYKDKKAATQAAGRIDDQVLCEVVPTFAKIPTFLLDKVKRRRAESALEKKDPNVDRLAELEEKFGLGPLDEDGWEKDGI